VVDKKKGNEFGRRDGPPMRRNRTERMKGSFRRLGEVWNFTLGGEKRVVWTALEKSGGDYSLGEVSVSWAFSWVAGGRGGA